jgi:hypothetical protein
MAIFHDGPPADFAPRPVPRRPSGDIGCYVPHYALFGGTQTRAPVTARQLLAYVWVEVLGRRARALAGALGQTRGNIFTAARRGATQAARWQAEIPRWCR